MDENPNPMNLDLNLVPPVVNPLPGDESMNLEEYLDWPLRRFREALRHANAIRPAQWWRSDQALIPIPSDDSRDVVLGLIGGSGLETGEGSAAREDTKLCEDSNGLLKGEELRKKDDVEKGSNVDEGCFFDCNICLDLAREPVVTCCGHLFCWSCVYRWLNVHSDNKECPVCKGEVTTKNVTPIYGRVNNKPEPVEDSNLKIPPRPQARRVESWRQTIERNAYSIPMQEMIRRLGNRFDFARDIVVGDPQNPDGDTTREFPERRSSLLNRILTSRGLRREQNTIFEPEDDVELNPENPEVEESQSRQRSPLLHRRSNLNRAAAISGLASSGFTTAEMMLESLIRSQSLERNQDQIPPVDDRDSLSSIAAVIQSESQTVDTAAEIDSMVSHSTSSSRRRNAASRVSDVDSGDSPPLRRRRFNPN